MPRLAWWLCAWSIGSAVGAQELEPRAYTNVPIGLNFLIRASADSDGGVLFDPSVALDNASVHTEGPVLGYARSVRLGEMSSKIDAGLSHVCLERLRRLPGPARLGQRFAAGAMRACVGR